MKPPYFKTPMIGTKERTLKGKRPLNNLSNRPLLSADTTPFPRQEVNIAILNVRTYVTCYNV